MSTFYGLSVFTAKNKNYDLSSSLFKFKNNKLIYIIRLTEKYAK